MFLTGRRKLFIACFAIALSLVGCQNNEPAQLDEDTIASMVDALLEHPKYQESLETTPEQEAAFVDAMVDALLEHPGYQEFLETTPEQEAAFVDAMVDALLEHPGYQELFETTPKEDCVTTIVMAAVISGDYTVPPDDDVERLCEFWRSQLE